MSRRSLHEDPERGELICPWPFVFRMRIPLEPVKGIGTCEADVNELWGPWSLELSCFPLGWREAGCWRQCRKESLSASAPTSLHGQPPWQAVRVCSELPAWDSVSKSPRGVLWSLTVEELGPHVPGFSYPISVA